MRLVAEIWQSFRRLPLWVQIWVAAILVPVNLVSLAFWAAPYGALVAVLAIGGMAPNLIIMAIERGFSRLMSLPHIVLWTPLCVLALWLIYGVGELAPAYQRYLALLLVVDVISLVFDFPDYLRWRRGERDIA